MTDSLQNKEKAKEDLQKEEANGVKKTKRSKPIKQLKKLSGITPSIKNSHTSQSSNRRTSHRTATQQTRAERRKEQACKRLITQEKRFVTILVNIHVLYSLRETMASNLEMLIQRITNYIANPPEDSILEYDGQLLQDQMSKLQFTNNAINGELQKYESLLTAI